MQAHGPAAQGPAEQREQRFPYLPSLDGLRALAVAVVLLYHADLPVRGGYLGVEAFFVLSGFLITGILVAEWLQHGRIDLGNFWMRRARRLLPALLLVIAGVLMIAATLPPAETGGLRADILAALGYVMNWHLILSGQSYFDAGVRPALLQHLWSLAVEEQFYLLWPLLFALGARLLRPLGLLLATLALAVAGLTLGAMLFDPGADPSRIYYGTDTRSGGLLLGAALAMLWAPWRQPILQRPGVGLVADGAGLLALGGLGVAAAQLFSGHPLLYRGGLALVALATILVIMGATHPHARLLPRLLGLAPLRWVGQRSYGIYLWHWPIFQITRPYLDVPMDGPLLLALRIGAAVLLAELSFRFVEEPVRRGALVALWRNLSAAVSAGPARGPAVLFAQLHPAHAGASGAVVAAQRNDYMPQPDGPQAGRGAGAPSTRPDGAGRGPQPPWRRLSLVIAGLLLTSVACASIGTPPSAPVAVASPTPAPVALATEVAPSPTNEPEDTPTVAPSATPSPTPAPTETATATATATPLPATATAAAEAALPPLDAALAAQLQAVLDRAVADGYIPGAVVAVNIPGRQTWVGASGVADEAAGAPMTADTRVRIASISKTFTAATVLLIAEDGLLSLDDPLSNWVPDLVPDAERISIRHLLQHRTGLYDFLEDRSYVNQAYSQPDRIFAPSELVQYAAQFPPAFPAGAEGAWDYSSTNYVILGMVVEAATGNTLAEEMRARIFEPLGLDSTYFNPDEPVEGPFAAGHFRAAEQRSVAMSFAFATANIVSTAGDVQAFGRALFAGDLLSPESREQLLSFVGGKGQYNMPDLGYGLGVMRNVLPVGRSAEVSTVYGHIGGFGGFRSALWHAPESGVTLALGVNQGSTDPNTLAAAILDVALMGAGR
jgi:peptidoglycan/LPS O-acetylase OafA/YrhL/CubicO group peptidase (beta-lactamase class C family)